MWLVGSAACSRFGSAGREQASIQQGRVIQAGLKLNFWHSMPELTFSSFWTPFLFFLVFRLFKVRKIARVIIPSIQSIRQIRFTSLSPLPDPVRRLTGIGRQETLVQLISQI